MEHRNAAKTTTRPAAALEGADLVDVYLTNGSWATVPAGAPAPPAATRLLGRFERRAAPAGVSLYLVGLGVTI